MFQRVGGAAYKKDLTNTIRICNALGNPERKFKSIHVAGTNGKGSSSHYLAAVLQATGLKTGLYTSPHLKNFTERIKINGAEMDRSSVINFVNKYYDLITEIKPSFFEITVAMAFDYFSNQNVDIAVVEVGMGGRLDSTNVINPLVSLITNISLDHQQWLGNDIQQIAREKGGIIKPETPVVIGETQEELTSIFNDLALKNRSDIYYADHRFQVDMKDDKITLYNEGKAVLSFVDQNIATYQKRNLASVLQVLEVLKNSGYTITNDSIIKGLKDMKSLTGLKGRWQVLSQSPKIICDVGHNEAGVKYLVKQLKKEQYDRLRMVWGTVNDKDITSILKLLPKNAEYYFCQSNIPRALGAEELMEKAKTTGLNGRSFKSVEKALEIAKEEANEKDLIFVGGSTFVVAELDI